MQKKMSFCFGVLLLFCGAAITASASEVSLNATVTNAKSGDTIGLLPIVYSGPENCDVQIRGKHLTLMSSGGTVIDCEGLSRCLVVSGGSSVTVVGVTFMNGRAVEDPSIRRNFLVFV